MARYRGFNRDRRLVIGVLQQIFGPENVFASPAECHAEAARRRAEEARAEQSLRAQFEYELLVLTRVAEDEGRAAHQAHLDGDAQAAYDSAFRAAHVARLVTVGAATGRRVWAFDVVGRCLVAAGVQAPPGFVPKQEVRALIMHAETEARRVESQRTLAFACSRRGLKLIHPTDRA